MATEDSLHKGIPQAPKAAITQAMRELAEKLQGGAVEDVDLEEEVVAGGESKWKKFWPGAKA